MLHHGLVFRGPCAIREVSNFLGTKMMMLVAEID
jgi:hypothetical protein